MTSTITPLEELNCLAEEIKTIIITKRGEMAFDLIHIKHLVGQEIVQNPLYQKWSKGSGDLIKRLSELCGASQSDLYYCVQFAEKYPDLNWNQIDVSTQIETSLGYRLNWTNIKANLPAPKEDCPHNWQPRKVVVEKWFCDKCNKWKR